MTTAVSLSGGYGSAYNLWKLAQTSEEIVAIFVDFDYYRDIGLNASESKGVKSAAQAIVNWVSANVKPIEFIVLNINNYDPQYSGFPALEILNYAKSNGIGSVVFNDDIKDDLPTHNYIRTGISKIKGDVVVSYPIREANKINYQTTKEMPFALLSLCTTNPFFQPSVAMENSGSTIEQIITKQKSVIASASRNQDSEWVSEDETYGNIKYGLSVRGSYPQFINLWLE